MDATPTVTWTRRQLAARAARALNLQAHGGGGRQRLDKYLLHGDPALLGGIAAAIADRLPSQTESLAAIELGGVPLATALSLHTGLPWSLIRRADETRPNRPRLAGPPVAGRTTVIVKDMAQSGAAILDAARVLREAGATVAHVAVGITWNAGLAEVLAPAGIEAVWALELADFEALRGSGGSAGEPTSRPAENARPGDRD